jgi:ABC-type dipeptide/oligopeptide/nickel transport system ATPase component
MNEPRLLIADEPTTALDVTVQAQVMTLLRALNQEHGTAVLLVSHNIALLSEICHRVLVMYRGNLVDDSPVDALRSPDRHPYTRALIGAVPDLRTDRHRLLVDVPEFDLSLTGANHA